MARVKVLKINNVPCRDIKNQFGRPRKLLWPFNIFRATIPMDFSSCTSINSLERVVLDMIKLNPLLEYAQIADLICVDKDLVNGLILHLKDKGLLDENGKIDSRIAGQLDNEKIEYGTVLVFQDCVGGKLLPYLHNIGENGGQIPIEWKDFSNLNCKPLKNVIGTKHPISNSDVIEVSRKMKERSRMYDIRQRLIKVSQVKVSSTSELCFFEVTIFFDNDGEYRILSPIDNQFSLTLESSFRSLLENDNSLEEWVTNWRKTVVDKQRLSNVEISENYPFDKYSKIYPNLVSSLHDALGPRSSLSAIYSSLEWAFFYFNEHYNNNIAINKIRLLNSSKKINDYMLKCLNSFGFDIPKQGLLPIKPGSLDKYLDCKPDLITALTIAVCHSETDDSSNFRMLAVKYPDFINRSYILKSERDSKAHGQGYGQNSALGGTNIQFMQDVINTILPKIVFTKKVSKKQIESKAIDYNDLMFQARTECTSLFGYSFFCNKFNEITQKHLVDSVMFLLEHKDTKKINSLSFFDSLYSALQSEITEEIDLEMAPINPDEQIIIPRFKKIIKKAGLSTPMNVYGTTNTRFVMNSMKGNNKSSLNAVVIAYCLCCKEEKLLEINKIMPNFLSSIEDLVSMRGHNNLPVFVGKDTLNKYKKLIFQILKVIKEV